MRTGFVWLVFSSHVCILQPLPFVLFRAGGAAVFCSEILCWSRADGSVLTQTVTLASSHSCSTVFIGTSISNIRIWPCVILSNVLHFSRVQCMESAFNICSAHLGRQGDGDCKAHTGRGGALEHLEIPLLQALFSLGEAGCSQSI